MSKKMYNPESNSIDEVFFQLTNNSKGVVSFDTDVSIATLSEVFSELMEVNNTFKILIKSANMLYNENIKKSF